MIKFQYQFPVYDRTSGQNVFDWIMVKSAEARKDRKLIRELQYRAMILSKEPNGELSQEKGKEAGKAKAPSKGSTEASAASA